MQVFADSKMQTYQLQSLATAVAASIATIEAVQIKFGKMLQDPKPGFMAQSLSVEQAKALKPNCGPGYRNYLANSML